MLIFIAFVCCVLGGVAGLLGAAAYQVAVNEERRREIHE